MELEGTLLGPCFFLAISDSDVITLFFYALGATFVVGYPPGSKHSRAISEHTAPLEKDVR